MAVKLTYERCPFMTLVLQFYDSDGDAPADFQNGKKTVKVLPCSTSLSMIKRPRW
jgi:hypothetical protein